MIRRSNAELHNPNFALCVTAQSALRNDSSEDTASSILFPLNKTIFYPLYISILTHACPMLRLCKVTRDPSRSLATSM